MGAYLPTDGYAKPFYCSTFHLNMTSPQMHCKILNRLMNRVYQGLPETHGVFETGHLGMGTVVHFGTPQYTVYPYRGVAGIHG